MEVGVGRNVVSENLVANPLFAEPRRHSRFDDGGHGKGDPLKLIIEVTGT